MALRFGTLKQLSDPVRTGPDVVEGKMQPDNCRQELNQTSGVNRNLLQVLIRAIDTLPDPNLGLGTS